MRELKQRGSTCSLCCLSMGCLYLPKLAHGSRLALARDTYAMLYDEALRGDFSRIGEFFDLGKLSDLLDEVNKKDGIKFDYRVVEFKSKKGFLDSMASTISAGKLALIAYDKRYFLRRENLYSGMVIPHFMVVTDMDQGRVYGMQGDASSGEMYNLTDRQRHKVDIMCSDLYESNSGLGKTFNWGNYMKSLGKARDFARYLNKAPRGATMRGKAIENFKAIDKEIDKCDIVGKYIEFSVRLK